MVIIELYHDFFTLPFYATIAILFLSYLNILHNVAMSFYLELFKCSNDVNY
jgi:hypothetical protein